MLVNPLRRLGRLPQGRRPSLLSPFLAPEDPPPRFGGAIALVLPISAAYQLFFFRNASRGSSRSARPCSTAVLFFTIAPDRRAGLLPRGVSAPKSPLAGRPRGSAAVVILALTGVILILHRLGSLGLFSEVA